MSAGVPQPQNHAIQRLDVLLSGGGYNFYASENQARADDLLVRQRAAGSLADAVTALSGLHAAYQRRYIPAPSRERPFAPAEETRRAQDIKRLRDRVARAEGQVRGMATPAQDRTWARFRRELPPLNQLLDYDHRLIDLAEGIYQQAVACTPEVWRLDETAAPFEAHLGLLEGLIRDRERFLLAMG